MTDSEISDLRAYLAAGGTVLATGPSALPECESAWVLPTHPEIDDPSKFFSTIANGVWHKHAEWITETELPPSEETNVWREAGKNLFYNPHRVSDGVITDSLLALVDRYARAMPIRVTSAEGYFVTVFEGESGTAVHLLAKDYDTDIDHHLDEIRFHRSRVNFINKVEPIGIASEILLESDCTPKVYLPFSEEAAIVKRSGQCVQITPPAKTAYMILFFEA